MSVTPAPDRDLIVIGASAGGIDALQVVLQALPPGLRAAVVIVQHLSPRLPSELVDILQRSTHLPVAWAEQGQRLAHGHVYVAPPDAHVLFADGHLRLARSAHERHARPSIDVLFRAAAAAYGPRAIAVLLTGMMDDGVDGLRAVRAAGGVVLIQDPATAAYPELPAHAQAALAPERTWPIDEIGPALRSLAGVAPDG